VKIFYGHSSHPQLDNLFFFLSNHCLFENWHIISSTLKFPSFSSTDILILCQAFPILFYKEFRTTSILIHAY
jgi:hypothetical protein